MKHSRFLPLLLLSCSILLASCGGGSSDPGILDDPESGGSDTGGSDTGGSDTGGSDTGGSDTGGSDTGGSDTGGSDTGGSDTGGSDTGGSDTGGSDTGGSDTGGSDTGGSDTGGSDTGGSDTGGSDTGGSDTGGSDTGGSDTGGSDTGGESPDNASPVIGEFNATPDTVMIDETVALNWDVQDSNNDTLTCTVDMNGDGTNDYTITPCNSDTTVKHIYNIPGEYAIKLEVTDGQGGSAIAETDVNVLPLTFKIVADTIVKPESWMRYQLTISNVSSIPLKNINILYRVPAGQQFRYDLNVEPDAVYDNCYTCDDGDEVYWDFETLDAGQSRTIDINAYMLDTVATGRVLTAPITVTADGLDPIKREKSVTASSDAQTMVEMSSPDDAVQAGDLVKMLVDFGNISNVNLAELQLRTYLPLAVSTVSVSDGGSYDASSNSVLWSVNALPVLQTAQRSLTFQVPGTAVPGQILTSRSELSRDGGAVIESTSEYAITVSDQPPIVSLDVDVVSSPVKAGGMMSYEVTVNNTALIPVKNVRLSYRVPHGMNFRYDLNTEPDAKYDDCYVCAEQSEVYWDIESIAAGQSHTFDINAGIVDILQAGNLVSAPFKLTADGLLDDISLRKTFSVSNASVIELAMSSSSDALLPGDDLTFNVDAGNVGRGTVSNLVISTDLPAGVIVQSVSDGGTWDSNSNTVTWSADNLPVSETLHRFVSVTVPTDAYAGQIMSASTQIRHDGGLEIDQVAEHSVTITGNQQPLSLNVRIASGEVKPGERMRFEITLKNESLVPIKNVMVLLRTPAELSFRYDLDAEPDAKYADCYICTGTNEVYWTFPSMGIDETQLIELNANVLETVPVGSLIVSPFRATSDGQTDDIRLVNVSPVK